MGLNEEREIEASEAVAATRNNGAQILTRGCKNIYISVDMTAVSGTSPTDDITVEWSTDGGTTWFVPQAAQAFTQITATGKHIKKFVVHALTYRIVETITGTDTPTFTRSIRELQTG